MLLKGAHIKSFKVFTRMPDTVQHKISGSYYSENDNYKAQFCSKMGFLSVKFYSKEIIVNSGNIIKKLSK